MYVSTFHNILNCICFPRGRLRAYLRHVQPGLVVCGGLALGRHLLVPLHRRLQPRGRFRLGLRSFGFSTDCDVDAPPQPAALRRWEIKRVKETTSVSAQLHVLQDKCVRHWQLQRTALSCATFGCSAPSARCSATMSMTSERAVTQAEPNSCSSATFKMESGTFRTLQTAAVSFTIMCDTNFHDRKILTHIIVTQGLEGRTSI